MTELIFSLGISSADAIVLRPEFDYKESKTQIKNSKRTISGKNFNYIFNNYQTFEVPVDYVHSDNAAIINSWWLSDTKLIFYKVRETSPGYGLLEDGGFFLLEDGQQMEFEPGYISEVFSVYIVNRDKPLSQITKPYDYYYRGTIQLESY